MAMRFLAHRFNELHPYEVQALLLNACNLKCVYCRCPELRTDVLSTAEWKAVIGRLADLGTIRIKFQGGEPTLRSDFRELTAFSRQRGLITAVVTNGLRVAVDPSLLDNLDEAVLSLDAVTPALHDRLRGAGTHAQVVRAIDLARERGVSTFVAMVVTTLNLAELEAMLAFCEARGIQLHAQPMLLGREAFDDGARDLAPDPEAVRDMHGRMAAWKRAGRPLIFGVRTYLRGVAWPDYRVLTVKSDGESACMAGRFYVHIDANGDVLPCRQHGADFTPKNVRRDGIDEAIRHARGHNCGDCFSAYLNERKHVFALQPAALLEIIRRR